MPDTNHPDVELFSAIDPLADAVWLAIREFAAWRRWQRSTQAEQSAYANALHSIRQAQLSRPLVDAQVDAQVDAKKAQRGRVARLRQKYR